MKTFIKSIACALALTTSVAFAHPTEEKTTENSKPTFETSAFVSADANIRLAVKKFNAERVFVSLRDAQGNVLFSETIGKNKMGYAAKINVSDLTDGAYELEVFTGKTRVVKHLNLSSKKVETARKVTVE